MIKYSTIEEKLNDIDFQKSLDDMIDKSDFEILLDRSNPLKYSLKIPIVTGEDHKIKLMLVAEFEYLVIYQDRAMLVINFEDRISVKASALVTEIGRLIESHLSD